VPLATVSGDKSGNLLCFLRRVLPQILDSALGMIFIETDCHIEYT
jgi:hypothetical protein